MSVVYASSAADRRRGGPDNGLRYERRQQVIRLRRRYRELREAGCSAWRARNVLWATANDAIYDTAFVPYTSVVAA